MCDVRPNESALQAFFLTGNILLRLEKYIFVYSLVFIEPGTILLSECPGITSPPCYFTREKMGQPLPLYESALVVVLTLSLPERLMKFGEVTLTFDSVDQIL